MSRKQYAEATIGSSRIAFQVSRSGDRESLAISVHPSGEVTVKAPKGTRIGRIRDCVTEKGSWILQQQEEFRRLQQAKPRRLVSGESLYYLGRQYRLKIRRTSQADCVRMFGGRLEVPVASSLDATTRYEMIRRRLAGWYRERANRVLADATSAFSQSLGVPDPEVRTRLMSQRWGSSDYEGRVTFNWTIVMAPMRLVQYVAAHEVCHLVHHNHSQEFWRLLERVMPDFENRRIELAITGAKFRL